jgi:hypothetical protein
MTTPLDLHTAYLNYRALLAREQCRICGRTQDVDVHFPPSDLGAPAELQVRCPEHVNSPMPKAP